jgi:hypothetical protein
MEYKDIWLIIILILSVAILGFTCGAAYEKTYLEDSCVILHQEIDSKNSIIYYQDEKNNHNYFLKEGILEYKE